MKTQLRIFCCLGLLCGLAACYTAHEAASEGGHVVDKAGRVAEHGVRKTGHAIAHGGEEIEEHTQ